MGGSPENSSGKFPDINAFRLIDDDKWHDITFDARVIRKSVPEITLIHMFEFSTYGKTGPGQKFWFDDFAITP